MSIVATMLIDHDNLPNTPGTIQMLLREYASRIEPTESFQGTLTVRVRAYGGWFLGTTTTEARYKAVQLYQSEIPTAFHLRDHICRVYFEFADRLLALADDPRPPVLLTHTVASRAHLPPFRMKQSHPPCEEPNCELISLKRWLRKKHACTRAGCPHSFADVFERLEQKQVDVHMALDLVCLCTQLAAGHHVALTTDDYDLLPALVAARRRLSAPNSTVTLLRFGTSPPHVVDLLHAENVTLVNLNAARDGASNAPLG